RHLATSLECHPWRIRGAALASLLLMNDLASGFRRRLRHRAAAVLLCGALCVGGTAVAAAALQPLPSITDAAKRFVRSQMPPGQNDIVITASRLDPRLRLARCGGP